MIADTVVAAMLVPIAATILAFQGYETTDEIKTSAYPTLVLLAIGWGAAAGGSATPLGGGMDILTIVVGMHLIAAFQTIELVLPVRPRSVVGVRKPTVRP